MSGPIVRTGTTPKFWQNWDRIFGEGTTQTAKKAKKSAKASKPAKSEKPAQGKAKAKSKAKSKKK